MLNKLFPLTDYNKLHYDKEGLYSITNYKEANIISNIIKNNFLFQNNLKIIDGTSGLGGNSISFASYFSKVTSIEIDNERCEMLKNNINQYNLKNIDVLNLDSVDYILQNKDNYDIYFFDPPWGGPQYKKYSKITLKLGNYNLSDIALKLKNKLNNKLLVYKLPFNYNFDDFSNFNYKLYKINKYYIIIILL